MSIGHGLKKYSKFLMSVQTGVRWVELHFAWAVMIPAPARLAKKLGGLANGRFMTYSLMLRNNVVEVVLCRSYGTYKLVSDCCITIIPSLWDYDRCFLHK